MLSYLSIRNLSVIESTSLEFTDGLNILTGETGAGKSVLVGAIKLLLGERASKQLMRDESKKLMVEGIFQGDLAHLDPDVRESYGIADELIIRREVDASGKNRIFINGQLATVQQLKELGTSLADIHGQHEHQSLLNPANHLHFIDSLVGDALIADYKKAYDAYAKKLAAIKRQEEELADVAAKRDVYEFQVKEIDSLEINLEEDAQLGERIRFLSHIEKVRENAAGALNALAEGEEANVLGLLAAAEKDLDTLADFIGEMAGASDTISSITYQIEDITNRLREIFDSQEADPETLNILIDRQHRLDSMMKKYDKDLSGLLEWRDHLVDLLDTVLLDDKALAAMKEAAKELEVVAKEKAARLNEARVSAAAGISEKLVAILADLELPQSTFDVRFEELDRLDAKGGVSCEFYLSTNPGFDPAPLAKVASGGEVSRVMLAFKEVFADSDVVDTLLFDEIDTGISGKTASRVAKKLKAIAKDRQIIVITHLPVVAAMGESHFHITKAIVDNVSNTKILALSDDARKEIIAMMIAGDASDSALRQAAELLSARSA